MSRYEGVKSCKFCGMAGLRWTEIAPEKFRLMEPNGAQHDCPAYHASKKQKRFRRQEDESGFSIHNDGGGKPGRELKLCWSGQLLDWMKRWGRQIPEAAMEELDDILDTTSANAASSPPSKPALFGRR